MSDTLTLQKVSDRVGVRPKAVKRIIQRLGKTDEVPKEDGYYRIPKNLLPDIQAEADKIQTRLRRAKCDVDLKVLFESYLEMDGDEMARIRKIMEEALDAEVSQRVLADFLNHRQPTISNYESDKSEIPRVTALALWLVFERVKDVSPEEARRVGAVQDPEWEDPDPLKDEESKTTGEARRDAHRDAE